MTPTERKQAKLFALKEKEDRERRRLLVDRGKKFHNLIDPNKMINKFINTGKPIYLKGFGANETMDNYYNIGNNITNNVLNSVKNNKNKWVTLYLIKKARNEYKKLYYNRDVKRNKLRAYFYLAVKPVIFNIANSKINKKEKNGKWARGEMEYNKMRNK